MIGDKVQGPNMVVCQNASTDKTICLEYALILEETMETLCVGGLPREKGTSNILDVSAQLVVMMEGDDVVRDGLNLLETFIVALNY